MEEGSHGWFAGSARKEKEKAYVQKWKIHVAMWKSCLILWTENGTLCWSVPFLNENRFDIVNWSREWLIFPIWLWPMRWRHCSMHKSLIGALTTRCRPGWSIVWQKKAPSWCQLWETPANGPSGIMVQGMMTTAGNTDESDRKKK